MESDRRHPETGADYNSLCQMVKSRILPHKIWETSEYVPACDVQCKTPNNIVSRSTRQKSLRGTANAKGKGKGPPDDISRKYEKKTAAYSAQRNYDYIGLSVLHRSCHT